MLVVLTGLGFPAYYARENLRQDILNQAIATATREAKALSAVLDALPSSLRNMEEIQDLFSQFSRRMGVRLTYVDNDGNVLVETGRDPGEMDNHRERAEIRTALDYGSGSAVRDSASLQQTYIYAAQTLHGVKDALPPGVLRVALRYSGVEDRLFSVLHEWLLVLAVTTALSLLLAWALSARVEKSLRMMFEMVESIARGTPGNHLAEMETGPEFTTLAAAVKSMADRIDDNIRTIAQQKAQLETILDIMDEGVLVLDVEGRISLVNKALTRLFPQLAEGKDPRKVLPLPELQRALDSLREKPRDWIEVSTLQVTPRPNQVLSVHLVRPRVAMHDVWCVAVFHDVSEIVRLMHMRRDFMANVSHELRTPLTVIQGTAETLLDLPDNADNAADIRARFLGVIMRHATHMACMVEDLLHLARIESGSLPMNIAPTDAAQLVHNVLGHVLAGRPELTERGIVVECHLPEEKDGGLEIMADAHFLSQVFRNLLENAIRHTPDNSVIRVSGMRWVSQYGPEAVFSVSDNGPGFPPDDLLRVFERFYKVEKHRTNPPSTGLGLAICKHIVERHKGHIWAENAPGGTVRFTVPLKIK